MNANIPPALERAQRLTRLDLEPNRPLPSAARVVLAGVLSVVASLIADLILVAIGRAVFDPPASFDKFNFATYAALTIIGVVGATAGWALLVRMTSHPRWLVLRAAVLVTIVLLVPDFALLPRDPTGPVMVLMIEHIAIAVVTTVLLLTVAPAGRGDQAQPAPPPERDRSSEEVLAR